MSDDAALVKVYRAKAICLPPGGTLVRADGRPPQPVEVASPWVNSRENAEAVLESIVEDKGDQYQFGTVDSVYVRAEDIQELQTDGEA